MTRILVIIAILAVAAVVMVVLAKRRKITEVSNQEPMKTPVKRDRPAGPAAETMDPDQVGGHPSAN